MSLISGALGGLAGLAGSALSAHMADKATDKQISWERERAQNAHQWEVDDLKAAGLNPVLSAGGQGANTGGIDAKVGDTQGLQQSVNQGIEAIQGLTNAKKAQEDANLAKATTSKTNEETIGQTRVNDNLILDGILKAKQGKLVSAQTASELAKRNLQEQQSMSEQSKRTLMREQALAQQSLRELNKANAAKSWQEADMYNDTREERMYRNKHRRFTYWNEQAEKMTNSAGNLARTVKDGASAITDLYSTFGPEGFKKALAGKANREHEQKEYNIFNYR